MYIQEELSQIVMDAVGSALIAAQERIKELETEKEEKAQSDIVNEANARLRRTESEGKEKGHD